MPEGSNTVHFSSFTNAIYSVDCRVANFTHISSVRGCYKLINSRMNWTDAGLECRSLHKDAHLLVINHEHEQAAVAGMLASTNGQYPFHVLYIVV